MKNLILFFLFCILNEVAFSQIPIEQCANVETGFIYYIKDNKIVRPHLSFIPLKFNSDSIYFKDFNTSQLKTGYLLSIHADYHLDTLEKYAKEYKLKNNKNDSALIILIPVKLRFSLYATNFYSKSQFKKSTFKHSFEFKNKIVKLKEIGGLIEQICLLNALMAPDK